MKLNRKRLKETLIAIIIISLIYLIDMGINRTPQTEKEISIQEVLQENDLPYKNTLEEYLPLDHLNRATGAYALITKDSLPTEKRQSIQKVYPTGWKNKKYKNIPGGYLYNRCHLIAHSLTGQNDNWKNLITCTRQANEAMIPYEKQVRKLVEEGKQVLYIVKPIFEGDNKLASSIKMIAYIDNKEKLFSVEIPNEQEGIEIDYKTGSSRKGS